MTGQFQYITAKGAAAIFFQRMLENAAAGWPDQIGMRFNSTQEIETYPWLGASPAMRQWVGNRVAKQLTENKLQIRNLPFEATLEVKRADMRRDKTGQITIRMQEMADNASQHDASLLSTLVENAATLTGWDGKAFFATNHTWPNVAASPTIDNKKSVDISGLPVSVHGSTTGPSVSELALCISAGITAICGYKNEVGKPINGMAKSFLAMVPLSLYDIALAAVTNQIMEANTPNPLANRRELTIGVVPNVELTWTDRFAVFRTDAPNKPFIIQSEEGVTMDVLGEGSDYFFDNDAYKFGVKKSGNVGYGDFTKACQVIMT